MKNENPHGLEPDLPPPFHFRYRGDLLEEMEFQNEFLIRPANAEEAARIGRHYPKFYDPREPMRSVETILSSYVSLPRRVLIASCSIKGTKRPHLIIYLGGRCNLRVTIPSNGPYAQLYDKAEALLAKKGIFPPASRELFFPQPPGDESEEQVRFGTWGIGYERETGHCAILDGSIRPSAFYRQFLLHRDLATLDLKHFKAP